MIIGVPKEIKNNENRVALTPAGTQELVKRGHTVYIQTKAGDGSGFSDDEYNSAGAKILSKAEEVFGIAEMIMKVKEPIEQEYDLIRKDAELQPDFAASAPASLRKSAELFLNALYDEGRGVRALLTSPEAFVDANLAPLYGLSGSFGTEFKRMDGMPSAAAISMHFNVCSTCWRRTSALGSTKS